MGYSKGRQSSQFLPARTTEQMLSPEPSPGLAQAAELLFGPIVRPMKNCLLPRLPGSASVLDFGHLGLQLRFGSLPGQTDNKRTTQRDSPGSAKLTWPERLPPLPGNSRAKGPGGRAGCISDVTPERTHTPPAPYISGKELPDLLHHPTPHPAPLGFVRGQCG